MARPPLSQSSYDEELLQPSLDAAFDVRGFRKPWNPSRLLWVAFFGGPLGAGALYGDNYARLNRPDARLACWIGGLVLALAAALAGAWLFESGALEGADKQRTQMFRWGLQGGCVAIGWFLTRDQAKAFRAFEASGGSAGKLLLPGIVACVLSALVFIGMFVLCVSVLRAAS